MSEKDYDLIIIWAGPAWYPAWTYASRYWVKNLIIWAMPWWLLTTTHRVENFPWIMSEHWRNIMNSFKEQAINAWSDIIVDTVNEIKKENNIFQINTKNWKEFKSRFVILATGTSNRKLLVKWENEFYWKWVSYCATCDWMFFKDQTVAIIWWGNTALTEALYLSNICKKVYLIHRSESFRCDNCWLTEAKWHDKIEILINEEVEEIAWDKMWVTNLKLKSGKVLDLDWIFIAVWNIPNTQIIDNLDIEKDREWYVVVDKRQETSLKWLYAAWDITTASNKFKQAITAAAEWGLAANSIQEDMLRN